MPILANDTCPGTTRVWSFGEQLVRYDGDSRAYGDPEGTWRYPSATACLALIDKPALKHWFAAEERKAAIRAASELYLDAPVAPKMSGAAYEETLKTRLGKQKAASKVSEAATTIGTGVHGVIEHDLCTELGLPVGARPRVPLGGESCYAAFLKWRADSAFKPTAVEQVVYSHAGKYAGTFDALGTITHEGQRVTVCLDWKTSKAMYPEYELQSAAYCAALVEMGKAAAPVHGLIVRLPKTTKDPLPEFKLVRWEAQGPLLDAFLAARRLWQWQQGAAA